MTDKPWIYKPETTIGNLTHNKIVDLAKKKIVMIRSCWLILQPAYIRI